MQLRRWLMRSSIQSLIRYVLSGQKPLLTTGKSERQERLRASIQNFRRCYKVPSFVVAPANSAVLGHVWWLPVFAPPTPLAQRVIRRAYGAVKPAASAWEICVAASAVDRKTPVK